MMHRRLLFGHVLFWLLVASIQIITMIQMGAVNGILYWLTAYLLYLSSFYINLFFIFPQWIKKRRIIVLLRGWLGLIILDTAIILILNKLFGFFQHGDLVFQTLKFFFQTCWILGILIPLSMAYRFAIDWFRNDRIKRQLENQHLKTELAFLRSQINPHFFFNTLNSIYVLAYKQSPKTADAVMRLSDIMQYMLYESNEEQVPVQKEMDYIKQLLALQELRITGPMALDLTMEGDLTKYNITPMLLIPFVENIFKHAVLDDPADPVLIRLAVSEQGLYFSSSNRINRSLKDEGGGIGLVNARRRMELLYPEKHQLDIEENSTHYSVKLNITHS